LEEEIKTKSEEEKRVLFVRGQPAREKFLKDIQDCRLAGPDQSIFENQGGTTILRRIINI
jgi:hypothetical protein